MESSKRKFPNKWSCSIDALRTRDTSWYIYTPYWGEESGSITLRYVSLFGFNLKCQKYYYYTSRVFISESWSWKNVALGVGNYFEQIQGYGGENYSYLITTELVGVLINGVSFGDTLLTSVENETTIPREFKLYQNYPNPFNPTTNITYNLKEPSFVKLTLYNILGEEVNRIVNNFQSEGSYNLTFNGSGLASGVYIYRLEAKSENGKINFVDSKKLMLIK